MPSYFAYIFLPYMLTPASHIFFPVVEKGLKCKGNNHRFGACIPGNGLAATLGKGWDGSPPAGRTLPLPPSPRRACVWAGQLQASHAAPEFNPTSNFNLCSCHVTYLFYARGHAFYNVSVSHWLHLRAAQKLPPAL